MCGISRQIHILAIIWVFVSGRTAPDVAAATTNAAPNVVPAVQQWQGGLGRLDVARATLYVDPAAAGALKPVARLLQEDFERLGLRRPDVQVGPPAGGKTAITLSLAADLPLPPVAGVQTNEAYVLDIGDTTAALRGRTPAGVFYATRTLLQLLAQSDARAPSLPRGVVTDGPQYRRRMLMLDVGRKPFPLAALHDYLRVLAWFKLNELHLHLSDEAFGGGYTGFRVQCDTFPGLASRDLHYTKPQLRELQDAARSLGITITPEIDMPGHSRVFTDYWPDLRLTNASPSYMDVTNPQTVARMQRLLDELIPLFDAPDFHIGTDEYRVGGSQEQKTRLHEAFRQFINTMDAHVRARGKRTRIWSGFEHMLGTTDVAPSVIIDMWETDDARGQIAKGHSVINSNHGRTYIVPGCHYYGVNNSGIYSGWEPWMVSGDMAKNPAPTEPRLLGGKLHVWNDQGPTGYTLTEIAALTRPSLMAFAEKLWGRKGSADYAAFQRRAAAVQAVPGVALFDRLPARTPDGLVLERSRAVSLATTNAWRALPFDGAPRADLEPPWTLTLEVRKTAETGGRGVLLSSDLAEICDGWTRVEEQTATDPATGKGIKTKVTRRGLGVVRAAGTPGPTPGQAHLSRDVSRVYGEPLPLNQWVALTIVGQPGRTAVYVGGKLVGEHGDQTICPLARLGSRHGASCVGEVRALKVYNRAFTPRDVGRQAGLDIPDNLATGAVVTATASDVPYGFLPQLLADGNPATRWSSAPTRADQAVTLDLGAARTFNAVKVLWENAFPRAWRVAVSDDGAQWREVAQGEGRVGTTELTFATVSARHVRLSLAQPATQWGYSIWEVEILRYAKDR